MGIGTVLAALAIGLTLGLVGAGGSVLTMPLLLGLGVPPKTAIAEGLAVVAVVALLGALAASRHGGVLGSAARRFAPAVLVGTVVGTTLAARVPAELQLAVFALAALAAAWRMARGCPWCDDETPPQQAPVWRLTAAGLGVGLLTGLVGVGGGFLIVPAMVLLAGVPMRLATGTSLAVVATSASIGFAGHWLALERLGMPPLPERVALISGIAAVGVFAGGWLGTGMRPAHLRRGFAVLLVLVAIWLLLRVVGVTIP